MGGSHYNWCVYMLHSSRLNVYYVGITTDLERRLVQHNRGRGAKYTRGRGPWEVVLFDWVEGKSLALRKEVEWKKLSHDQKAYKHLTHYPGHGSI